MRRASDTPEPSLGSVLTATIRLWVIRHLRHLSIRRSHPVDPGPVDHGYKNEFGAKDEDRASGNRSGAANQTTDLARITTLRPRAYNEARVIGEHFREGIPVIMNLTEMVDSDAKRLVDFAAGLIFGLHGSIERVPNKIFLLSPANVEVADLGAPAREAAP